MLFMRLKPIHILLLAIIIITGLLASCASDSPVLQKSGQKKSLSAEQSTANLYLGAVGDTMLGTDFPDNWLAHDDGHSLLAETTPILRAPDITFANLEGVLLDGGEPRKQCAKGKSCYLFRSPERYAQHLVNAGIDVVSLANNHARDFGESGRGITMQTLDKAGILHSGLEGDIASWQVKGLRIALIAFAPFAYAHDMLDIPKAVQHIQQLDLEHDIIIVSMHAGAEGLDASHIPFKEEKYFTENRGDMFAFSHAVIDAGADMVIGHGPHVPRAMELYKDRLIAYSLGNFATYWGISVADKKGWAPILLTEMGRDGSFVRGKIVSMVQIRPHGPLFDFDNRAAREIAQLTRADFPHTQLNITADGVISRSSQTAGQHHTSEMPEILSQHLQ